MINKRFIYSADAVTAGGAITLEKGNRGLVLDKEGNSLTKVYVGAGWDMKTTARGDYDLDLFAICLDTNGKAFPNVNGRVAYFGNKTISGVSVGPDNLTGRGDGDDESCNIDFASIPAEVGEVIIGINIYRAIEKGQNFGQVNNAFVRYASLSNQRESIKKFDLTEDYSGNTGVLAFRFYRHTDGWKYQALGEGVKGDIQQIYDLYK